MQKELGQAEIRELKAVVMLWGDKEVVKQGKEVVVHLTKNDCHLC